jgi:tetratricopeptide (TPR) repeat protein
MNPAGRSSCERCNFPLVPEAAATPPAGPAPTPPPADPPREAAPSASLAPASPPSSSPFLLPPRPPTRRQRPGAMPAQALSIWLLFAVVTAGALIYTGVKVNLDRARQPVEGSSDDQQKRADDLRQALERDSTNVDARVALGNLLYDTGNWPEAIIQYRAVLRRDSTRTGVLVDLGVCYYNLGQGDEAEKLFRLAVQRDPHQPVALFNLGIVSERRSEFDIALQFYHRALESGPPDEMKPILVSAMQRVQEKTGRTPKPLPDGR